MSICQVVLGDSPDPARGDRQRQRWIGAAAALILIAAAGTLSGCGLSSGAITGAAIRGSVAGERPPLVSTATANPTLNLHAVRGTVRTMVRRTRHSASVGTLAYIPETLDNCGPAAISSVLAYWHVYRTQAQVQASVRADDSDFGMAPFDVPAYTRSLGLRAVVGPRGNQRMIKSFISNGIPVIVNQWVASDDAILHYRPVESYSDRTQTYVSADPYLGPGHVISFAEFRSIWQVRDRRFIVIFPPSKQALVNAILRRAGWNYQRAYKRDLAWFAPQLRSDDIDTPGTWLNYNGYVEAAWAADQAGEYRVAGSYLREATRAGESAILIHWIWRDMSERIKSGIR